MIEKITEEQVNEYGVVNASDKLTGTAEQNKAVFDRLVKQIVVTVVNQVVEELNAATATLDETKHTHANKDLLDTYNQTNTNLKDAVSKKHSHSNKSVLDKLTAEQQAVLASILGVTQSLGNSADHVPSEKAVADAMAASGSIPSGGTKGQALVKNSATARDVTWADMLPIIDANSAEYDMTAILTSGPHCGLYRTGTNTEGTPYKLLGISWSRALILSCALAYSTYGFQVAFVDGNAGIYWRGVNGGTVYEWRCLHHDGLGTLHLFGGAAKLYKVGGTLQMSNYETADEAPGSRHLLLFNRTGASDDDASLQMWSYDADGAVSKYKLYGEHNLTVDAPTYSGITKLGLKDADLSATDFMANVKSIVQALPSKGVCIFTEKGTNLAQSALTKFNADTNSMYNVANYYVSVRITKYHGNNNPVLVEFALDGVDYHRIYACIYNAASDTPDMSKFTRWFDANGFLPLTGGKLTGDLSIANENPKIRLDDTEAGSRSYVGNAGHVLTLYQYPVAGDDSNYRGLYLRDNAGSYPAIERALELYDVVTNSAGTKTGKIYKIYGSHNKPSGTYTGTEKARTINVGGTGNVLFVQSSGYTGIVTSVGSLVFRNATGASTPVHFDSDETYISGVLTLSASAYLNDKDEDYTYQNL